MKTAPASKSAVSVPIIILSDSDSDAEGHSVSQRATQPLKRSATSASGNSAKGPRYSNCRDCNSKCAVQVDQTPSNFGRKVNFPTLHLFHSKNAAATEWLMSNMFQLRFRIE
jgi:hypothetical protein